MIVEVFHYVAGLAVILGSGFSLLAALGILRFPDLYTRLHAATKAGVVGVGLVLLGLASAALDGATALRALGGIIFLVLTSPVSAHLLARAAYAAGLRPANITVVNVLVNVTDVKS